MLLTFNQKYGSLWTVQPKKFVEITSYPIQWSRKLFTTYLSTRFQQKGYTYFFTQKLFRCKWKFKAKKYILNLEDVLKIDVLWSHTKESLFGVEIQFFCVISLLSVPINWVQGPDSAWQQFRFFQRSTITS